MRIGYAVLIGLCVLALYVLFCNILAIKEVKYQDLKNVCIGLFIFSMTRYIALIIYGDHASMETLNLLRYFYFATSIGLTLPTASAVWYVTPLYREKVSYLKYLACFLPWILFYVFVIFAQPTSIEPGPYFGYTLALTGNFSHYLAIVQGSFVTVIIILSIIGIIKYKNVQMRVQYVIIILAQIVLAIDGILQGRDIRTAVPPFTLSEIIGFWAVYEVFKMKHIEVKGLSNTQRVD